MARMFLKVIACEIAFREITHLAAQSPNIIDLQFITQGLHDVPRMGGATIQEAIDAVPGGKYDAILLGYGLCGHLVRGITAREAQLVLPRAHDCITFFLGSKERYARESQERLGTYFYSSGWLECLRRRGHSTNPAEATFMPTRAGVSGDLNETFRQWVEKYGEERAQFLMEQMTHWSENYGCGALIDFDFTKELRLEDQVKSICSKRSWRYEVIPGDLGLLRRWLNGDWDEDAFQIVKPGERVVPTYDDAIVGVNDKGDKTD